jgi:hypothetical protein
VLGGGVEDRGAVAVGHHAGVLRHPEREDLLPQDGPADHLLLDQLGVGAGEPDEFLAQAARPAPGTEDAGGRRRRPRSGRPGLQRHALRD